MTWSYDATSSADLDVVRGYIGDTNSGDKMLEDEVINRFIAAESNLFLAAASCIEFGILPKIARDTDHSELGFSSTRSAKTTHYQDLVKTFRAKTAAYASIFAGGISISRRDTNEADADVVQPSYTRDRHRNT